MSLEIQILEIKFWSPCVWIIWDSSLKIFHKLYLILAIGVKHAESEVEKSYLSMYGCLRLDRDNDPQFSWNDIATSENMSIALCMKENPLWEKQTRKW